MVSLSSFSRVAVLGSRALPGAFAPAVAGVARSVAPGGLASCCASGACAFVRAACPSCVVFRASAFPSSSFAGSLWLRSAACVRWVAASGSGAVVVFLASPGSVGSVRELRFAASLGVACFAFACGFPAASLPSLGAGAWSPVVGGGALAGAFVWVPAVSQPSLF